MRTTIKTFFVLVAAALIASCSGKRKPNYQYFPNMYESVAYEAYSSHNNEIFADNGTSEALTPVAGTVNRGWLPYDYENSNEGYQAAKAGLKNPLPYTAENAEKGKALYDIYCAICHGAKGNGKGHLVKAEKILGVPSYDDPGRAITEGSIYHVMYYGINSMGSYASQTSIEERWQIVQYVESLKAKLEGKEPRIDKVIANTHNHGKVADEHGGAHDGHVNSSDVNHGAHDATSIETHSGDVKAKIEGAVDHVENTAKGHIEEAKESVKHSKKSLLQGKSHHSHKESGKK